MAYRCLICEKLFDQIPDDAMELARSRAVITLKFPDNTIHLLRKIRSKPAKAEGK